MHVNDLLKIAVESGASDLHLKVGSYPMMRVHGMLTPASEHKRLTHEDTVAMAAAVMSTTQRQKFKESQEVDLAYSVPGLGRFRCNVFQQRGTIGIVLRVIPMGSLVDFRGVHNHTNGVYSGTKQPGETCDSTYDCASSSEGTVTCLQWSSGGGIAPSQTLTRRSSSFVSAPAINM